MTLFYFILSSSNSQLRSNLSIFWIGVQVREDDRNFAIDTLPSLLPLLSCIENKGLDDRSRLADWSLAWPEKRGGEGDALNSDGSCKGNAKNLGK